MPDEDKSDIRIVQQKKKGDDGVYINLSSKKTGLNPGDAVQVDVMDEGILILKKLEAKLVRIEGETESTFDKILEALGLKNHIDYRIVSKLKEYKKDMVVKNGDTEKIGKSSI